MVCLYISQTYGDLAGGRHTSGTLRSVSQLPQLRWAQRWRCELWANGQLPQAVRGSMQPGALGMDGVPQIFFGAVFQSESLDLKKSGREVPDKKGIMIDNGRFPMKCSLFWTQMGGINIGELGMLGDLFGTGTINIHVVTGGAEWGFQGWSKVAALRWFAWKHFS